MIGGREHVPETPASPAEQASVPKSRRGGRFVRALLWTAGGLLLLLALLVIGVTWYTRTRDFQQRVGKEVVSVLENSTGGKVDLGGLRFDLWHLAIEVDGLVIHGLEGPGEAPYLSVQRVLIRLRINTFISHTIGQGAQSHIGLNFLRAEQPEVHLIITKDGKTNQPVPKHPSTSKTPIQDTLLDLQAKVVELVNGVALVNDRAIPFDVAARDLQARVNYLASVDRYGAVIDLNDLRTRMAAEPEAQSKMHLEAQLGRDLAEIKKLDVHSGAASDLHASASLKHFANPEWEGAVDGSLELKQISVLGGVSGLNAGALELHVKGHNCYTPPTEAQKQPGFSQQRHPANAAALNTKVLPPDPDCQAGYLVVGDLKLHNAGYADQNVRVHDINGKAQLHVTPTELLLTALTGYLPGGGSAAGDLRISNWLGEVPTNTAEKSPTTVAAAKTANTTAVGVGAKPPVNSVAISPVQRARAILKVTTNRIPLRTIMDIAAPKGYGDLGFDTAISGPVTAEWGGPASEIVDTVDVDANLHLAPTGVRRPGARSNVPVRGELIAHFIGKTQVVKLQRVRLETLASTLEASGVLGINKGDPLTDLRLNAQVRDLGEYDQMLETLGFAANGKKGSAALPVVLHGSVGFDGTARGALRALDIKGHVQANDLQVRLGTEADVHIDSVVADAEYTPAGLAVASSTVKRGTAVLNVSGAFKPRRVVSRGGAVSSVWDDGTSVDAKVQLAGAQVADVLEIAGQKGKYDISGTMDVNVQASGTLKDLSGTGQVSLANGVAYGEPYESAVVQATIAGKQIEAKSVVLRLHGMQITGNGAYNLATERVRAHIQGNNLQLSKFALVQKENLNADAVLSVVADADGTLSEPGLKAHLGLTKIEMDGQGLGQMTADLHSEGKTVFYNAISTLVGASIDAVGQTSLTGNLETQAKLTLRGLDVAKVLPIVSPTNTIKATSAIAGVVTVSGPLKTPTGLSGTAVLDPVSVTVQGVDLKAEQPLRVSLRNGVATLDQVRITAPDTNLSAGGTAQVFGVTDPKGGALNIRSNGSINTSLLHTFDRDLISKGKVEFQVTAGGRLKAPALAGNVRFEGVDLAMNGIPNGLTDLQGTLVFNEDRLVVQQLTATTGGGLVKVGGFLTYRNGFYADLTATGKANRLRYNGLSATVDTNLALRGGLNNLLLSGNVVLTRFGVGPDVDFAAFAGSGGVSAPPNPSSFTNNVQLDIHIASSPQLDFQNSYAKLAGMVDLTVRGTLATPTVLGRIQITDGSATFAGTKYQVQRGSIYFSNPVRIDPLIDLDVTTRVENYDITISLHGTPTSLKPTYRSEPPLSEADVFNLLALGRTQEEAQLYQEQQVQAGTDPTTSALLGGALNATVSSRVSKLFGGGSVKIDPAFVGTLGNSSARITVQQQLSRQLAVTFATNVNSSAQQLIQLTYAVSENQSIVATRDETGVFSIVYKLRKRYR